MNWSHIEKYLLRFSKFTTTEKGFKNTIKEVVLAVSGLDLPVDHIKDNHGEVFISGLSAVNRSKLFIFQDEIVRQIKDRCRNKVIRSIRY